LCKTQSTHDPRPRFPDQLGESPGGASQRGFHPMSRTRGSAPTATYDIGCSPHRCSPL